MKAKSFFLTVLIVLLISGHAFGQLATTPQSGEADSFFFAGHWQPAIRQYEQLLEKTSENRTNVMLLNRLGFCYQNIGDYDKALEYYKRAENNNPSSSAMKQSIYSRMAKSYASKMDYDNSITELDKAVAAGYINFEDMDSSEAYRKMQSMDRFKKIRDKAYYSAYPCMANPHSREFDFWVGEWDVYSTGTNLLRGHSVIQRVSGGCLILENWTSVGLPYNGKSMNFVDSTGKWQQVWVGVSEMGGPNVFVNGEYKDSAMHFVFTTKDQSGKDLQGRFTFYNQGTNQVRQWQETSADNGKTWQTVYDLTYTRKK